MASQKKRSTEAGDADAPFAEGPATPEEGAPIMAEKVSTPALKPRKVLHIDTATTWRGPQNQLLLLVKGMEARGWPVHVACPVESPLWEAVEFLGDRRVTIPSDLSERTAVQVFRAQPEPAVRGFGDTRVGHIGGTCHA